MLFRLICSVLSHTDSLAATASAVVLIKFLHSASWCPQRENRCVSDADRCSGVGFLFMHFLINTSRLIIPHPIKCCITAQKHSRQQPVTLQQDLQDLTVDFNVALFTTITLQCSGNFYCSVESSTVEATLTVTPLSFFFFFLLGLYFRSCGPSPHHVQGPTPALRPAPPARAAAD